MAIGVLTIEIHLLASFSLKEKRMVIKGVKDRLSRKYNVAVAELDFLDKWQRSKIGIVTISNSYGHLEESLQKIFAELDSNDHFEITSYDYEYI